jgi:hypothetical protein
LVFPATPAPEVQQFSSRVGRRERGKFPQNPERLRRISPDAQEKSVQAIDCPRFGSIAAIIAAGELLMQRQQPDRQLYSIFFMTLFPGAKKGLIDRVVFLFPTQRRKHRIPSRRNSGCMNAHESMHVRQHYPTAEIVVSIAVSAAEPGILSQLRDQNAWLMPVDKYFIPEICPGNSGAVV